MIARLDFATPQQALREMVAAGAVFAMRSSLNGIGREFSYRVADGGDAQRCSEILAAVKSRPPAFLLAFRFAVQDVVASNERGVA